MKKIAPRISDSAAKFLAENFKSTNAGAEYMLDSFSSLFMHLKQKVKKKFLKGELLLMIDVMNATMLTPESVGRHLEINIKDGIELEGLDAKREISAIVLGKKFHALDISEKWFLEIWSNSFWYGSNEGEGIEEYVEELI